MSMTEQSGVYALLVNGSTVEIRPARAGDYGAVKAMHEAMSPDNAYLRFFGLSRTAAEAEARRICLQPRPGRVALLAVEGGEVVGVASYEVLDGQGTDHKEAEIAFAVADRMHHRGIATLLLEHLVWYARSHGVTAFTRSNKAVTRFEPIQTARFTWAQLFTLSGDGRLGPLDLLMSGTPDTKGTLVQGIYYARLLPELSATVATSSLKGGKFKLTAKVTDAGEAVSGATVSAKGQSTTTNAKGSAKLTIKGSAGDHVTVTISHSGYRSLKVGVTL